MNPPLHPHSYQMDNAVLHNLNTHHTYHKSPVVSPNRHPPFQQYSSDKVHHKQNTLVVVSTADYAIPVQNRFDMLNSTPGSITCEASPASPPQYTIHVHISERDNVRHEPPATPAQQMTQSTILQATDYLLIGDLTIKQISPNKMNIGEYFCVQKICAPSMKTIDTSLVRPTAT